MLRSITLVLAVALLVPGFARADTGGADLPDTWDAAVTVPLGTYTGELGGTDDADWYRVELPDLARLRVTLTLASARHVHLSGVTDDGTFLFDEHFEGLTVTKDVDLDVVRIGVDSWVSAAVSYTLVLEGVVSPDLSPSGLVVAPVAGDADGTLRTIDVDVTNLGGGAASGALDLVVRTRSDGVRTAIGSVAVDLAPGASTHVQVLWDTARTGTIGDADVIATTRVAFDQDPTNNEARAATFGVVSGTGGGITLRAQVGSGCTDLILVFHCFGFLLHGSQVTAGHHANAIFVRDTLSLSTAERSAHVHVWTFLTDGLDVGTDTTAPGSLLGGQQRARVDLSEVTGEPAGLEVAYEVGAGGIATVCASGCTSAELP